MTARNYISLLGIFEFFAVSLLFVWPSLTRSQTVVATVPVGPAPRALAVNPVTNKIYVATCHPRSGLPPVGGLSVIDGETNATTTVPGGCAALAVNSVTNKIYVVNAGNATVIDGATNSTNTLSASGSAVAVNEVTNKIYVAKGSVNLGRSGRSPDTQRSAAHHGKAPRTNSSQEQPNHIRERTSQ